MRRFHYILLPFVLILPISAQAGEITAQPVSETGVNIRYLKGVPTIGKTDDAGGVIVTQADPIYGRLRFRVAISNAGNAPFNFGTENITVTLDGKPVPVMTAKQLEKIAKNRAGWATFAMAMAGGLGAAAAQANAYSTYSTVGHTPYGSYSSTTRVYNPTAATLGTAAAVGGTVYGVDQINRSLDATLEGIRENVIQTTTVDPASSYGGVLVIDKIQTSKAPQRLEISFKRDQADPDGYSVAYTVAN